MFVDVSLGAGLNCEKQMVAILLEVVIIIGIVGVMALVVIINSMIVNYTNTKKCGKGKTNRRDQSVHYHECNQQLRKIQINMLWKVLHKRLALIVFYICCT